MFASIYDLIIERLLKEGILDNVLRKYDQSQNVHKKDIHFLSDNDPSGRNKYLVWMVKELEKDDDLDREYVIDIVEKFHNNQKNLEKKDLNQYSSIDELTQTLREYQNAQGRKRAEKRHKKYVNLAPGTEMIYKDDRFVVLFPTTHDAVCSYGAGTKWCITERDADHFKEYSEENVIFYYIFDLTRKSNDPFYKVAIAVMRDGDNGVDNWVAYDAEDDELDDEVLKDEAYEGVWDDLRSLIVSDAESRPWTDEFEKAKHKESMEELHRELEHVVDDFNGQSSLFYASNWDLETHADYDGEESYYFAVDIEGQVPIGDLLHAIKNKSQTVSAEEVQEVIRTSGRNDLVKYVEYALSDVIDVGMYDFSFSVVEGSVTFRLEDEDLRDIDNIDGIKSSLSYYLEQEQSFDKIALAFERELVENGEIENWLGSDTLEELELEQVSYEPSYDNNDGHSLEIKFVLKELEQMQEIQFINKNPFINKNRLHQMMAKLLKDLAYREKSQLKFAFADDNNDEEDEDLKVPYLPDCWVMVEKNKAILIIQIEDRDDTEEGIFWAKFMNKHAQSIRQVFDNLIKSNLN